MAQEITMPVSNKFERLSFPGVLTAIVLGLYLSSRHSYLLFHSLIEITTIAIGFSLYILTWNARRFLANNFFTIIGIGYALISLLDLFHALAYKGMNVFPGFGANLPTQLWIAARFLQAVTLCLAPFFVARRVAHIVIFGGYAAVVSLFTALVFTAHFPDCFIEGKGLTPFKIDCEYAITVMLLASLYLYFEKRRHFSARVFYLTVASIVCTAISEISFTTYVSVYGFANMVGHFSKLAAFYLIYRAILVTGIKEPFDLIFRELGEAQTLIRKANDTLEEQVRARTAELRASEEKYRVLIECANDAVFIQEIGEDGMPGSFLEANELACRRLDYNREELVRINPLQINDPRFHERVAAAMEELLHEGRALFETAQITKAGQSIPVEVSSRVLELQGRRLLFSLVRDISVRKRAEEAMLRLNRELHAISSCNQTLIRATDEQALLNEICRIVCEEAGYRMVWVGYAEHDEGKTLRSVAWGGVEDGYLVEAGITWDDTERGRGPSGTAIRNGKSVCIQDFRTDPSAVPWRESASRRGYRSSIALPLRDENANTFGVLNIYATEADAFTPGEVRLLEELAGDLAFGIMVLRARQERKLAEAAIKKLNEDLEERVRERTAELEQAYLDLQSAHSRILQQEKMASVGQLAAGVAHEINNPMGFIISNLNTLEKYCSRLVAFLQAEKEMLGKVAVALPENSRAVLTELAQLRKELKLEEVADDISPLIRESLEGGERVKRIVKSLKSFARLDEEEYSMADLNEGLESTISIVWNELKYKATLTRDYGDIPRTFCNPGQLNQVFLNLLINAAHAIEHHGEVRVETRQEDGFVLVSVVDTGRGIPADKIHRIFEPFFTTKEVGEGTGLGLSIAYDIVKNHGGELTVESEPGKGSRFTVRLPIRSETVLMNDEGAFL